MVGLGLLEGVVRGGRDPGYRASSRGQPGRSARSTRGQLDIRHALVHQEVSLVVVSFRLQRSIQRLLRVEQGLIDIWNAGAGVRPGLRAVVGAGSDGLGDSQVDTFPNLTEQAVILEASKVFLPLPNRRFTILLVLLRPLKPLIWRRRGAGVAGNIVVVILVLQVSLLGGLA